MTMTDEITHPPEITAAAAGAELDDAQEKSVLDWLLGPTTVLFYDIPVQYETPEGTKTLTFRVKQMDTGKIQEIDAKNRSGDGPFSRLDPYLYNSELVFEALVHVSDGKRDVRKNDAGFLDLHPAGPLEGFRLRFKGQGGLFAGIGEEIHRVSGFSTDRIGTAQRVIIDAVGNS